MHRYTKLYVESKVKSHFLCVPLCSPTGSLDQPSPITYLSTYVILNLPVSNFFKVKNNR